MLMWHMCLSFLLRHWVPRGQPKLVSSCAVYHPSGQLHQWGRLHPVKKGRWLSPSAQLRTLHHFGGSFGHTQHSREIWNGHVDKNVTSSTDQQSSNVRKRQRAKQDRWYFAFPQILKGSTSYFKRRRGKQNLFYAIYLYIYIQYITILSSFTPTAKSGRPLNVQVSKKLARLSHNHNMSNIVGPDNILTRLSSLHGPSFRSRGKGAASLWLNMTEGQTESESKNMNIILYIRIINTII